ncbi:3-hydroxydecanoyl-ACP dehydratase [Photobacterium kishitanii]|uniref:3-hydroxydecanoyl-ACP dehydratase n=1 Tax=Photobacterium kishitanii TaxID=318456 RepID=A0A0B7JJC3_9GAMM|nr:hotdog family protein [Photobacterium kishitanii]OBU23952.1 3-hydroxydecanoyl-ACP dehydratase [Photobacterium kishitanii]PSU89480.1 3-hydroxydecanoyl-ACP dehydratase [Photobacterium kishitanii]PSU89655.1 3-hydroxydecanoyl-ACP dehydratase [Photobacterium kishitanii]PSU95439.1 3-hydroxydecanoyl-ACP dehydratase [Photobacterium kishitanii]PSW68114.1 3-hydroxydecanoyl-ACP dehydratase [Photobacterium kishitanii]
MTKIPPLAQLLPHDAPMILIDELISVDVENVHCQVTIRSDNLFFDNHSQSVAGYVGIELMAQTIAAWAGYHAWQQGKPAPIGFLLGCRRYHSEWSQFNQGVVLDIYAERLIQDNNMAVFSCQIISQQQTIASCQLNAYLPSEEKVATLLTTKK